MTCCPLNSHTKWLCSLLVAYGSSLWILHEFTRGWILTDTREPCDPAFFWNSTIAAFTLVSTEWFVHKFNISRSGFELLTERIDEAFQAPGSNYPSFGTEGWAWNVGTMDCYRHSRFGKQKQYRIMSCNVRTIVGIQLLHLTQNGTKFDWLSILSLNKRSNQSSNARMIPVVLISLCPMEILA
jgi:hypothetical protein